MGLSCGIDVGGTKIAGAVVDDEGNVLEHLRVESPASDAVEIGAAIAGLVKRLRADHAVEQVGVGAAGYISADRATVLFAPNLAWRNVDLRAELEPRIGLPVVVENDAAAAAWGEFRFGAAADVDSLLMVTVGTGVGGGIVFGDQLHRGAHGVAAEIGHLRVVPEGRLCGCGKYGCFEQYASGSALERAAREAVSGGSLPARSLLDRAGDLESITGPMISELAAEGDTFCLEQIAGLGGWLGEGLASLAAVIDPEVFVIGGGVVEAGDLLLDPTRAAFGSHLSGRGYRPEAQIRAAQLGNRAGVIGAADLARR